MIALPEKIIIWLFVALAVFGSGWACRGMNAEHEQVKTLQADKRVTNENIEEAVKDSVKVDTTIQTDHARIDDIRQAVAARLAKPTHPEKPHDDYPRPDPAAPAPVGQADVPGLADPVLDAGTVRLLNAARSGAELRAAGSRDGEKPATAGPPG
jgi:hypothetical protein